MSMRGQEPVREEDMGAHMTDCHHRSSLADCESCRGRTRKEKLQLIQDLVRSDSYQVEAGLVAERIVEDALARKDRPTR